MSTTETSTETRTSETPTTVIGQRPDRTQSPGRPTPTRTATRPGIGPVPWLFATIALVATTVAVVVVTSSPVDVEQPTTGVTRNPVTVS